MTGKKNKVLRLAALLLGILLLAACAPSGAGESSSSPEIAPIAFPEASEEYVKAKAFYGYYTLQDSDVIFALNEDETRFCVKFYAFAGERSMILEGSVEDGACYVDPEFNGLFGEDVQMMYEDALDEEAPWAPITRD